MENDNGLLAAFASITAPLHTLRAVLQEKFYDIHKKNYEYQRGRLHNRDAIIEANAKIVANLMVLYSAILAEGVAKEPETPLNTTRGLIGMINTIGAAENNTTPPARRQRSTYDGMVRKIKEWLVQPEGKIDEITAELDLEMFRSAGVTNLLPMNRNVRFLIRIEFLKQWQDVSSIPQEEPELDDPYTPKFAVPAFLITALVQSTVVYAASYGLKQLFAETLGDALAGTICHAVGSALLGLWLGSGRGKSGIVSGLLVGASAFAIQVYAVPLLAQLLLEHGYLLPELELQLFGFCAIIASTLILESAAIGTSYGPDVGDEQDYELCFEHDFYMHEAVWQKLKSACKGATHDGVEPLLDGV